MATTKLSNGDLQAIKQAIGIIKEKFGLVNSTGSNIVGLNDKNDPNLDDAKSKAILVNEVIALTAFASAIYTPKGIPGKIPVLASMDMLTNGYIIAHDYNNTGVIDTANIWNVVSGALGVISTSTLSGAVGGAPGAVGGFVVGSIFAAASIGTAVYGAIYGEKVDIKEMINYTKEEVAKFGDEISNKFSEFSESFSDSFNDFMNHAHDIGDSINEAADKIGDFLKDKAEKLNDAFEDVADKVGDFLNDLSDLLEDGIADAASKAEDLFKDFADWVYDKTGWNGDLPDLPNLPDDGNWFDPFFGWIYEKTGWNGDLPDFGDWFNLNRDGKYYIYDPIVLDLDGDGIETIGANEFKGAMFDHDNDGIRAATGWIKSDDGFLVIDRNGDGIINNGTELFGDGTILEDGKRAKNGYEALAQLDSNHDGKIDANDENFNQLRIWRDLNQDGISQANELFTLDKLGIKSLNLDYTNSNTSLDHGNQLAEKGSYERTDGKNYVMGDVNFSFDSVYSKFSDKIKLTAKQRLVANLKGIGRVRDLREAAALSNNLSIILNLYSQATTKAEQIALLDQLVLEWAKTDKQFKNTEISTSMNFVLAGGSNQGIGLTPSQVNGMRLNINKPDEEWLNKFKANSYKVSCLNSLTGQNSTIFYATNSAEREKTLNTINKTYDDLLNKVYAGLIYQTRLLPYLQELNVNSKDGNLIFDFTNIEEKFNKIFAENPEKAFVDLCEFLAYSPNFKQQWPESLVLLKEYYSFAETNGLSELWIANFSNSNSDILAKVGIFLGSTQSEKLNGTNQNDLFFGGAGNDTINGGNGNDILNGGSGNDALYGNYGYDILIGGSGNDILKGGNWEKDRYEFEVGHGHDVIYDIGYNGINDLNDVVFKGANLADAELIRSGYDLIIHAYGSEDSLRLPDYFKYSWDTTSFKFIFDDQSITEVDLIKNYTFSQTGDENNNEIAGWYGNDILNGGAGDDKLWGDDGDDILSGEDGDDILYGGNGNDILNGGTGNDTLYGGAGNDTYIFAKNHGQDSIKDDHANNTNGNKIVLQDFNSDELWFSQNGNNLIINHIGTDDQISVENWFYSETYRQFTITTADNKAITAGQVQKLLTAMAGFTVNTEANISSDEQMHSFVQQGNIAAYWGN